MKHTDLAIDSFRPCDGIEQCTGLGRPWDFTVDAGTTVADSAHFCGV